MNPNRSSSERKPRVSRQETKKEYAVTHFLELRKNKSSMREIAKAFSVSTAFMYSDVIPEVSKRYGISHDDLLYFPHAKAVYTKKPGRKKEAVVKKATAKEILQEIEAANPILNEILDNLNEARRILEEAFELLKEAKINV